MAAALTTALSSAENRLLPTVPFFDGNNPEEQPDFVDALERCFRLATFTNAGKATLAVLRFPSNSPAKKWYTFNLARNSKYKNIDIWEPEPEVLAADAVGNEGEPGYVAAREAKPKRDGGLKQALELHWAPADDHQSVVKLQLTNKQNPGERVTAWLPRVQFNLFKLHKVTLPQEFREGEAQKEHYNLVLEAQTLAILKLESNPLLQKVFEDLAVHTVDTYTEAAIKWERTEEGKKWLSSHAPPSQPPKTNPKAPVTAAVRGGRPKSDLDKLECGYCGIKKSHATAECFKKRRDVENGKIQDRVDGYPLVPQKNRNRRGPRNNVNAAGGGHGGPPAGPPGGPPHGSPNPPPAPQPSGPPANAPFPQPANRNVPALQWNGAAASVTGGDLNQLYEYQQRLAASALGAYPHLASHPSDYAPPGQ